MDNSRERRESKRGVEGIYTSSGQNGWSLLLECWRLGAAIERATGQRRLAWSTRDERANHICMKFLQRQFTRTRRSCIITQKHMRLRAGPRPHCEASCGLRSLGGRPRARQWRTRPLLRGCHRSAWPGVRRPSRPRGLRPWLLKPRAHWPRGSCPCLFRFRTSLCSR